MSGSAVTGLCRLRFRAPQSQFELAVPADVPLADLLPAVVDYGGPDLAERGAEHGGWVLQRLGAPALDERRSTDELGLHDGELLYLCPRRDALPPVHFDDLVDGIAEGMRGRKDSWRPALTHHLLLVLALVVIAAGGAQLLMPGSDRVRGLTAGACAPLLLAGATAAARVVRDRGAGIALAAAAVPFAALAAGLLPSGPSGTTLVAARLLAGASAAAGAAVLALSAAGSGAPLFLGLTLLSFLGVAAGALMVAGLSALGAAAVLTVPGLLFGAFIPSAAFRLAGLRLPALPRNAGELQEDIEPFPAEQVLTRAEIADGYVTSFHAVLAVASAAALTVLARAAGWAPAAMTGALVLLLLLQARTLVAAYQRLSLVAAGCWGVLLLAARFALAQHGAGGRLTLLTALLLAATGLLSAAWTLPGRRMLPYWGRAAEILHTLTAVSLLPLALFAMGAVHALRGLVG